MSRNQLVTVQEVETRATRLRQSGYYPAIPSELVEAAFLAGSSGSVPAIALAIWRQATLQHRLDNVVLSCGTTERLGIGRHSRYRALKRLSEIGAISVNNRPGGQTLISLEGRWRELRSRAS